MVMEVEVDFVDIGCFGIELGCLHYFGIEKKLVDKLDYCKCLDFNNYLNYWQSQHYRLDYS